jgi:hypothetical protein
MQKIMVAMLGLLSMTGMLYAQPGVVFSSNNNRTPDERLFSLPPFSINEEYRIELGKGNAMRLELVDGADLSRFENIDSLLLLFCSDMKAFRDSLSDPLTTKHIDYLMENSGQKKLRIRQAKPAASTFLLDGSEPAILRLEQDTIYILLPSPADRFAGRKASRPVKYDRLGFFLNRYSELESYITSGLNRKIQLIQESKHKNYSWKTKNGRNYLGSDPTISAVTALMHNGNRLVLNGFVAAQNYKNYFAPSFSLGASVQISHGFNTNLFGVYWEPMFLFAPNAQGRLQTYRNDFLVARFAFTKKDESGKENDSNAALGFGPSFSLAYLIGRHGSLVEPHTFRLTLGSVKAFKGGLHLDPCLYFNDFFKGVTPGIRLSLGGF